MKENNNNHIVFPLVMGTLALLCFLAVALIVSFSVQPLWGRLTVLILPAIVLYAIAFISYKEKISSRMTVVLTVLASIVLVLASFFYSLLLFVWTATTEINDVKYYSKAYSRIENGGGVEGIFPDAIPGDAKDIFFRYNAPFLQGGEIFELSFVSSGEAISQWEGKLEASSEWIGSNQEWHRLNNWGFSGEDSTRYQIYWDGGYNHGEWSYVLINPSSSRITFCYEDW